MTDWFKRSKGRLPSLPKKGIPDGVWVKCKSCGESLFKKELDRNSEICPRCGYHFRMSSDGYVKLLLDEGSWEEHDAGLKSMDPLKFKDTVKYPDRIAKYTKKSGFNDAIRCFSGTMDGLPVQLAAMDFAFMGGSVGSVVGEKFCRAVSRAIELFSPLVSVSCSGGMRMQEGIFSLMQMAKVSAALTRLSKSKLPYISVMTDPTTGGTTASYAMSGDINIAEPGALIGFAGPRVIKQTIGQDLPEGFQSSEFVMEHGFMDMIVDRKELKKRLVTLLGLLQENN